MPATGLRQQASDLTAGWVKGLRTSKLPEAVFGACGAAVLYRRRMLDEIGFLDEDFFLYDEDTDLNFRAQLAGWKCNYVPTAVAYHVANATSKRLGAGIAGRIGRRG